MDVDTYTNILNKAIDLYRQGDFWEGYKFITDHADHEPRIDAQVIDIRVSLACRAGQVDLAYRLLSEAIDERNIWFTQQYLREDEDIKPATLNSGFPRLMELCAERERKARSESRSDLSILRGKETGERRGLIIVLHGNMQNMGVAREDWAGVEDHGYDLAFVRSSQLSFCDAYEWTDLNVARQDLIEQFERLKGQGELDDREVILAGFSAGARLSLSAVLDDIVKVDGMLLIAPWLPEVQEWSSRISSLVGRLSGCHIICGDRDEDCLPGARVMAEALASAGVRSSLQIVQGLGHDYPSNFSSYIKDMTDKAMGRT